MRDGKVLHFLKQFPAWAVLALMFFSVLIFYRITQDMFFQRVIDTILGAIIGVLTGRWLPPNNSGTTTTGDVNIIPNEDLTPTENVEKEEK